MRTKIKRMADALAMARETILRLSNTGPRRASCQGTLDVIRDALLEVQDEPTALIEARELAEDAVSRISSFVEDPDLRDLDGILADATTALRRLELTAKGDDLPVLDPKQLDDTRANVLGAEIARALGLRRDPEHHDRWVTGWGTKTNRGLARTLHHILT